MRQQRKPVLTTNKVNLNLNSKQNLITFVGKLNKAKGYDIFAKSIVKILNKHKILLIFENNISKIVNE